MLLPTDDIAQIVDACFEHRCLVHFTSVRVECGREVTDEHIQLIPPLLLARVPGPPASTSLTLTRTAHWLSVFLFWAYLTRYS